MNAKAFLVQTASYRGWILDFAAMLFNPMMIGFSIVTVNIPVLVASTVTTILASGWMIEDMSRS